MNIRSLTKNFDELTHTPELVNRDIICIRESWLNQSHFNSNFDIPGFRLIRQDRGPASRGGGLAVYIKSHIKFKIKDIFDCGGVEVLTLTINSGMSEFGLMLVYNPPSIVRAFLNVFERLLKTKFFIQTIYHYW